MVLVPSNTLKEHNCSKKSWEFSNQFFSNKDFNIKNSKKGKKPFKKILDVMEKNWGQIWFQGGKLV